MTDSPSNHEILLIEKNDPDELKLVAQLAAEGKTNLVHVEDDLGNLLQTPTAVVLPIKDYMFMLQIADPERHKLLVDEYKFHGLPLPGAEESAP